MPTLHRPLPRPALVACLIGLVAAITAFALATATATGTARAAGSHLARCRDPQSPARRDAANPLMLARSPANGDVLAGAGFYVAGPARGTAAGAIAQLLGMGVGQALASGQPLAGMSDALSWAHFAQTTVAEKLPRQAAGVQTNIRRLEKIAGQPTPLRISAVSGGGSPAAVYNQTRKLFCSLLKADPGTIPIVTTYFAHSELGGAATRAQINADAPHFKAQIDAMARAIGRRPVALFLELDGVGSTAAMAHNGALGAWESLIRYEALKLESLPHTAVYLEGGYSDAHDAAYAAKLLNHMGVRRVQGFFTNDTHLQWTSHELRYAEAVSAKTGGAHFVINTSSNGRGPLLNRHPRTQGVEDLCNPPGRGLGTPDNTSPGLNRHLDALLWVVPPGNSSGSCHGGPASGTFWVTRAEQLAANADARLGPGSPSRPF
jgi:hypothetical protein